MKKLGNVIIGPSNNWLRLHGFHYRKHTKRYKHERKDLPKRVRIRYHTMKKAGCDIELIKRFIKRLDNYDFKER